MPRRSKEELLKPHPCNVEDCDIKKLPLKTTQLPFEVVYDVDGGRTRAICFDCWEKREKPFGKEVETYPIWFV